MCLRGKNSEAVAVLLGESAEMSEAVMKGEVGDRLTSPLEEACVHPVQSGVADERTGRHPCHTSETELYRSGGHADPGGQRRGRQSGHAEPSKVGVQLT
ncbi:hypothetical protein GCM10023175_43240 [Pseudonocardia xishanensis]|uniref:Uncharacterized protein n=1 Tax=Pseudonocardia xishanensis TaxID=630995 RepID=A0ABP8RX33_9PSEU